MEHTADTPKEGEEQIIITQCDDKVTVSKSGKVRYQQLADAANTHSKQISELQIAILTLNKVLHIFRDRGLNSLETFMLRLEKEVVADRETSLHNTLRVDKLYHEMQAEHKTQQLTMDVIQDEWNLHKVAIEEGLHPAGMKRLERLEASLLESSEDDLEVKAFHQVAEKDSRGKCSGCGGLGCDK